MCCNLAQGAFVLTLLDDVYLKSGIQKQPVLEKKEVKDINLVRSRSLKSHNCPILNMVVEAITTNPTAKLGDELDL